MLRIISMTGAGVIDTTGHAAGGDSAYRRQLELCLLRFFFSIIAFLADTLRTEKLKQTHPETKVIPNLKILGFYFLCVGVSMLLCGISDLLAGNWWAAAKEIGLGVLALSGLFTEVYLRLRRQD